MKNCTLPLLTTALALAVCLAVSLALPGRAAQTDRAVFTFAADGVTASGSSEGVSVDGAALTVTKAGSYTVTGSCGEGSITVAKGVTGVTLELSDLTLASSSTAPLVCKKGSEVTLVITGSVTLTDREDPADETSADADAAEAFEGAAIGGDWHPLVQTEEICEKILAL